MDNMVRRYLFLTWLSAAASCLLLLLVWVYSFFKAGERAAGHDVTWKGVMTEPGIAARLLRAGILGAEPELWLALVVLLLLAACALAAARVLPKPLLGLIESWSAGQGRFLDRLPERWVGISIFACAAAGLFLELAAIRWQGTVFALFSIHKNFGLLACFAGLGLGYALSRSGQIPLLMTIPLLGWQMLLLVFTRNGTAGWNADILRGTPELEQMSMYLPQITALPQYAAVLLLLGTTFMLTALAFVPVGQLCGRLMERRPKLRAYGLNLLGSLAGVLFSFGLSYLWTPPAAWFLAGFAVLLAFQAFDGRLLASGAAAALAAAAVLSWPVNFPWQATYSPYQLVEFGTNPNGWLELKVAGIYHQFLLRLSSARGEEGGDGRLRQIADHYVLPYLIAGKAGDVVVLGAGTGNDVEMALRMGARRVDAVEIDPAIQAYGRAYHPGRPYQDPRVLAVLDDARTYLRRTRRTYDMVVYGLLDSSAAISHGSSVRLDSFVYTVEAFREARARLREGGILSLSIGVLSPGMGRKLYLMLQEAFDGVPPVCIESKYDGAITFLERKGGPLRLPPGRIAPLGAADVTARYADPAVRADVSTDDWPFLYMARRTYPFSYLVVLGLLLALTLGLTAGLFGARPGLGRAEFFLLGAGFLLVETKSITELGLVFGNTWHVIGIVIAGILLMAYAANAAVERFGIRNPAVPYALLLASLVLGMLIALKGGFPSTFGGRAAALAVLTSPLFFSGMVFSTALQHSEDISGALAANLVGAMVGGLLEYNAMYFGFAFLYGLAFALYGAAFWTSLRRRGA